MTVRIDSLCLIDMCELRRSSFFVENFKSTQYGKAVIHMAISDVIETSNQKYKFV